MHGVSWSVVNSNGGETPWNHNVSVKEAFEAVQQLPAEEKKKGFHVSVRFDTVPEATELLSKAVKVGVADMSTAQWMFSQAESGGWTPAYYNPMRWSRLASIDGVLTELNALPVKQQPVRINMQIKDLGEAISHLLQHREQEAKTEESEDVARFEKQLHDKDLRIQDLELQIQAMMSTFVGSYFLQKRFEKLPPLALRILTYWFGQDYDGTNVAPKQYHLWFGKSEETDREIRLLFGSHLDAAANGMYDAWAEEPLGMVALDILLDQFPRNIFRNTARSFGYDWKALSLTSVAIRSKKDDELTVMERVWLYLVFTHAEDKEVQKQCVTLAKEKLCDMEINFQNMWNGIFVKHQTVIDKFGRFPHRNKFMCRTSTPEEEDFVNDVRFRFDLPVNLTVDPVTGAASFNFVSSEPCVEPHQEPSPPSLKRANTTMDMA